MTAPAPESSSHALTWALIVVTYQRPAMLALCVRLALRQTRPPSEVIIFDASPDWRAGHALVAEEARAVAFTGALVYEPSQSRSIPTQRNIAIPRASADILFLIDDDSLLFPDCASRVMQVYECDRDRRLLAVGPVHQNEPPPDVDLSRLPPMSPPPTGVSARVQDLTWRGEGYFLPYDRKFPQWDIPPSCEGLGLRVVHFLGGYQLTVRRTACARIRFEDMLQRYAVGEDKDFTYRLSRSGALVEAPDARLHHVAASGGRLPVATVTALRFVNHVALHAVDGHGRARLAYRYLLYFPYHLAINFLRDAVGGAARLPRTRGVLRAFPACLRMLFASPRAVRGMYPAIQEAVIAWS
ncbi:MAG: hypothetical protein NVS9B3_01620 [Gemmatimonadaceae bacterium]